MADEAATAKDAQFILINLAPDVCLTPDRKGCPVPYAITHAMDKSRQVSPNVFFAGKPAYLHEESYVDVLTGDEPGGGKGVVSGTHVRISRSVRASNSVFVNGRRLVRTGDAVWMNRAEPGDAGGKTAGKKARWECRQGQIAAAREQLKDMPEGADKERLTQATERFARDNVAVEKARLSQDAYKPTPSGETPEGWNDISNDPEKLAQYGLNPDMLHKEGSNFRAKVYEPDPAVFGKDMQPTLAFKGSTLNGEDWKNNFAQGANMHSEYYKNAVEIGKNIGRSGQNIDITGHSLGGGLASAASQASGRPATTFNASGLHGKTVERYGGSVHDTAIQAYRVKGEILTGLQEGGLGATAGAAAAGWAAGGPKGAAIAALAQLGLAGLAPNAAGTPYELEGKGNPVKRHLIDHVIERLEAQKKADQAVIAAATGKTCKE